MMPAISAETDRLNSEAHKQLVLPALPALRGLAKLALLRPVIVVDSREQVPLTFTRLQSVRGTLYSGDYSVRGLENKFAVERKNLDDIANCCVNSNRDRFERELHLLRGFCFTRLLIIGTREDIAAGRYHSKIIPSAVLATLDAFEIRYSIPLVFCSSPAQAAIALERWVWRFAREVVTDANNLLRGSSLKKTSHNPSCLL
jgi:ERCC4-type nuclease